MCITGGPVIPILVVDERERDVLTTATLTCEGGDANPAVSMVTWYQDVNPVTSTTEHTLSINLTTIQQEGNYTCVETNQPPGYDTQTSPPSPGQELIVTGEYIHIHICVQTCVHI